MPEVRVDIEVYCASCGEGLCYQTESTIGRRGHPQFRVMPCGKCLDEAKATGYAEGEEAAEAAGGEQ